MSFNPDSSKHTQEVIFSEKLKKRSHSPLVFNTAMFPNVNLKTLSNHIRSKMTFEKHKTIFSKTNKI